MDTNTNIISMTDRVKFCREFFNMKEHDMLMYYIINLIMNTSEDKDYYIDFLENVKDIQQSSKETNEDWFRFVVNTLIFKYKNVKYKIVDKSWCEHGDDLRSDGIPTLTMNKSGVWCDLDSSCPQIIKDIKIIAESEPFNSGFN